MNRRSVLRTLGPLLATGGVGGCLERLPTQSAAATPTPVDLSGTKTDDQGGMVIGRHGGPNGQIFYADNRPRGHDNPAWFHTLTFGLFPYYFEHERLGWEATVIYVTDYSTVDFTVSTADKRPVMPAPTAPETFGLATEVTFVAHSDVNGGMGPALIPFSDQADVSRFIDAYGGERLTFEEITPVFINQYTGA